MASTTRILQKEFIPANDVCAANISAEHHTTRITASPPILSAQPLIPYLLFLRFIKDPAFLSYMGCWQLAKSASTSFAFPTYCQVFFLPDLFWHNKPLRIKTGIQLRISVFDTPSRAEYRIVCTLFKDL